MKGRPIEGQCRLCLNEEKLVDSHIIPKFIFSELKKDGTYYLMSGNPHKKTKKGQKGLTEHLLCANCDNVIIQKYETHLSKFMKGGTELQVKVISDILLIIKGYDYGLLKNSLLSITWRMSISSNPFFRNLKLTENEEESLRMTLLNNKTLTEDEFPLTMTIPLIGNSFHSDLIIQPDATTINKNTLYRFTLAGALFTCTTGINPIKAEHKALSLTPSQWLILRMKSEEIRYFQDFMETIANADKIRKNIA